MSQLAASTSARAPVSLSKLRRVLLSLCATNIGWIVGGFLLTAVMSAQPNESWSFRSLFGLSAVIAAHCALAWLFAVVPLALTVPQEHVICGEVGAPLFGAICGVLAFVLLAALGGVLAFFERQATPFLGAAALVGGLTWGLFAWGLRWNSKALTQAPLAWLAVAAMGPGLALALALFVALR